MNKLRIVLSLLFSSVFFVIALCIPLEAHASSLEFNKRTHTLKENEQSTVSVYLNTEGENVVGVDLILIFDPAAIKVHDIKSTGHFPLEFAETVDNTKGEIRYALSNSFGKTQSVSGTIAEIVIEGKKKSTSNMKFQYSYGDTTDTNVAIANGVDALENVEDLKIVVTPEAGNDSTSANNDADKNSDTEDSDESSSAESDTDVAAEEGSQNLTDNEESERNEVLADSSDTNTLRPQSGKEYLKNVLGISDDGGQVLGVDTKSPRVVALLIILIISAGVGVGFLVGLYYRSRK